MTRRLMVLVLFVLACAGAARLDAQDTVVVVRAGSPLAPTSRLAREAVESFNAPETRRFFGDADIRVDDVYTSDVAVLQGHVLVEGVVKGDLIAINSDVELASTAEVGGDLLVLGGTLSQAAGASVRGSVERYSAGLDVRRVNGRIELLQPPRVQRRRPARSYAPSGRANIVVATGGTYNRVEGLPLLVGPRIEWGREAGGSIEALAVFRTARELEASRENIGYRVDGSLFLGRRHALTLGARAWDVVRPFNAWGLTDFEVGAASFFLHRDYRDYFLTRGVSGYARLSPTRGVTLDAELSLSRETSIGIRDPWTLFRGDDVWRANPLIDEGEYRRITAGVELDSRAARGYANFAWLLRAEWERGYSDDVQPRPLPLAVRDPIPSSGYTYDRVTADLRLYQRIGWSGDLRLRALAGGTIGNDPLPAQRRFALGGPALMPGFAFRSMACNESVADASLPALCDRAVLLQAEYRGNLGLWFNPPRWDRHDYAQWGDWEDWEDWFWFEGPNLVLFADAGTAWLAANDPGALQFDVGVGLEFGSIGVYAARALVADEPLRFSVRLQRRF